ncbi:MAG TPA: HEAT repeat domain-containing protein [Polyangiaceae bacterium]|nr:HEAT repeat domain-containing protein [Polyangiaceae bacterium]
MSSSSTSTLITERERLQHVAELAGAGLSTLPELVSELVDASWAVRRAVVASLAAAEPAAMPLLLGSLRSSREDEAKIAGLVDALSATANPIDELVLQLAEDHNVAVVCDAAQILGRRESARAVPKLKELTKHPDDNVALAAVEALGRIGGKEALDCLLILAQSRNFFRTFPTIDILGRSGDSRALETLLDLSTDPLYGAEAVRALGRLGDPSAVPALLEQLSRASGGLVGAIALALVAIRDAAEQRFGTGASVEQKLSNSAKPSELRQRLALGLKRADPAEQLALSQVLSWLGEESSVPLLLGLLRGAPAVAQAAVQSLKRLGPVADAPLLAALPSATSDERRLLVPLLGGKRSARDQLIECLADEDAAVRALTCDALARTADPAAVPAIFPLLGDADTRVSQAALAAIQTLGSDETRRLALAATSSPDVRLRRAALRIIGYFGYPEGLESLLEASKSSDEKLREAAIAGLPFIDDPRAQAELLRAARHVSPRTRTFAMRALGHTAGDAIVREQLRAALGDADAWVRYYACQALGRLRDDSATDRIALLLEDPFGQVRVAAVEALAHLRGARAFEVLSGVLGTADADLNRAALLAVGLSKRAEALPQLTQALTSSDSATRLVALSALAELGLPEALPAIARATRDPDEGVRVSATGFLAARSDLATTNELIALLFDAPTRQPLIRALAKPGPGRCQAIANALSHADDAAAAAFVAALARMQTDDSLATIRAALTSNNDAARRAAASALVALQDPESANALQRAALTDPDVEVRRICAAALVR